MTVGRGESAYAGYELMGLGEWVGKWVDEWVIWWVGGWVAGGVCGWAGDQAGGGNRHTRLGEASFLPRTFSTVDIVVWSGRLR